MKSYNCTICGKEVSKRKSLAVEGGRACREHLPEKSKSSTISDTSSVSPVRMIKREKFIEAKQNIKTYLDLNYDPKEADNPMGPPTIYVTSCLDGIPYAYHEAFMDQMVKDGLVRRWLGGYADARLFNENTPSEAVGLLV